MINNLSIVYKGETLTVPYNTLIAELIDEFGLNLYKDHIMGAMYNNKMVSLDYHLKTSGELSFINPSDDFGFRIYVNSLTFILNYVFSMLFPGKTLLISHSLYDGLYFYLDNNEQFTEEMFDSLNKLYTEIVEDKLPIKVESWDKDAAKKIYADKQDKYNLLKYTAASSILVARIKDYSDFTITPIAINSGLCRIHKLSLYKHGILLRYAKQQNYPDMVKFEDQKSLFHVYKEQEDWGKILGYDHVGNLNKKIANNQVMDIVLISEALQDNKIANIVHKIKENKTTRLVLIAGPSSSGKTTFSRKLMTYLQATGVPAYPISLDNYFVNREKTPRDENGDYNFEVIEALDLKSFNDNLNDILNRRETVLPIYDFKKGRRSPEGLAYKPEKDVVIIVEGIHGLNPRLTYSIDKKYQFKIYISPLTQLNLTDSVRIPTTISRLYRRMVRDFRYRGISALETLKRWNSVRRGEDNFIFPFQNNADVYFNSSLSYELSVLRTFAEHLLKSIPEDSEYYAMSQFLMDFVLHFIPIPQDLVPNTSILREFIGGALYLQNIH